MAHSSSIPLHPSKSNVLVHVVLSIIFTTYLCYIDEGYFNFNWMLNLGNWIMFVIYASVFTAFQLLLKRIISIGYKGKYLTPIVAFAFVAMIFVLIFNVFKD